MTKGSILVISNEMNISRALRITLVAKGYEVTNTRTVAEAVDLSESAKHDLILLDNDSSSATATKACREIRACSAAAIIIMGSDTSEEKKAHAILAGADSYMPKPFGVAQIVASVRANMRKDETKSSLGVLVS
jgi:two-component system KDP operon response regulator KdpE